MKRGQWSKDSWENIRMFSILSRILFAQNFRWSLRNSKCVLWSAKTHHGWVFFEATEKGRSSWRFTITFYIDCHLYSSPSMICLIRQHLSSFNGGSSNQTNPLRSDRAPTMAVEINLGAQNSSSEASDTFSLLEVSEVWVVCFVWVLTCFCCVSWDVWRLGLPFFWDFPKLVKLKIHKLSVLMIILWNGGTRMT